MLPPREHVKAAFRSVAFLPNNRVVFDIKGNNYRLIAQVKYGPLYLVYIRFIGTHAEYDRVDATSV
ncbi:type II toxin-antitoxin system HigB family toxin [Sorangium sp. So ce1335]|uniref:type II toxin-antitoxin system HigB family toxin n=1 Tax=Sorangium sp. So ce1335 TaxID=3133335 RepID=UPI003F5EF377